MTEKSLLTISRETGCRYLTARERTLTGWVFVCRRNGKNIKAEWCIHCRDRRRDDEGDGENEEEAQA